MISFEEAYDIVSSQPVIADTETIRFEMAAGRILAEDIRSDMDMPPFDKSAVDGFACRIEDIANPMKVIETVPAGVMPSMPVSEGTCIRIMTGAPVPAGADMVLMVEDCSVDNEIVVYNGTSKNSNIAYKGEDMKSGALLMNVSTLLKPQHIAVMAAVGKTEINVYRQIKAGVLSTGSELVEPDCIPAASQIRNSNSAQLLAQIASHGGIPKYYGIIPDDFDQTLVALKKAIEDNDIVFLSGGVSMGEFDFIPAALREAGFEILFDSVAVQPGKPTTLARRDNKYIVGLPGNPVSSFVQFELLGSVLMNRIGGGIKDTVVVRAKTNIAFNRKKAERKSFYPVCFNANGYVASLEYHGSAHINSLLNAVGVVAMDIGVKEIPAETEVDVRLF
ncbi:MAG: molybdopterin molybdotransferase MoeA [Bacteroidales bacterium]